MDFTCPAEQLERLVRGLNRGPALLHFWTGKRSKSGRQLWKTGFPARQRGAEAWKNIRCREVFAADERGIWVLTGKAYLVLEEIQLEGKKRMSAADFLRGHEIVTGTVLG